MSYQIDHTDRANYGSITVEDQTINNETSLSFVGKNYTGYAKTLAENFLHLLENFARATAPSSPVIGQLWYDTNVTSDPAQPQLKIWDGNAWVPSGNVHKAPSRPDASRAVTGDLWTDTANQQLYLWSGSNWILVGPQFSEGSQSGPKVEQVYDTLNAAHSIIELVVQDQIVAIISKDTFTPKLAIEGFEVIRQGINISTKDFDGDGTVLNKIWGVAEKADALIVGSETVAASNFLRGDKASTTNYGLNVRSNSGITLGTDLATSITNTSAGEAVIYNKTEGSSIFVRVNQGGTAKDVLTVSGTNIGINKTNPTQALDVVGQIYTDTSLTITGTANATDLNTGSFKTAGGASVTKNLQVGENLVVGGSLEVGTILPKVDSTNDLGSSELSWRNVYANQVTADTFFGTFSGQLVGSVTGSASRLTSPTRFQLTGDVASNAVDFNGQQVDGLATFTTILSTDFISNKSNVTDSYPTDEFIINRIGSGLRRINKTNLLANVATVPAGAIFPFAGTTVPNGYLLCDGSEQLIANYPELFAVIQYTYKALGLLQGVSTFALPDLRGRFPLGRDSMNMGTFVTSIADGSLITTISSSADRVTDVTADTVGLGNGQEEVDVAVNNLPDHTHDLKGNAGNQYYAFRNVPGEPADTDAIGGNGPSGAATGQYLSNSGGIDTTSSLGLPINVMNPYLTINYIIFTGRIV
jgi:microcystin-dependent protein